jgi:glucosamine--fructose-6-phosphate aminotransferase (isomerizing)
MGATEQTIFDQFPYWRKAAVALELLPKAGLTAFVGCGSSYNLAMTLAATANAAGWPAVAVPGDEWTNRRSNYWAGTGSVQVVAISRSGETSETVAAAKASRAAGIPVIGITVETGSALAANSDRVVAAETDKREGIVMTTSASLMLQLGLQLLGISVPEAAIVAAEEMLKAVDAKVPALLRSKSHFVYLGSGAQYGVGVEGALKLMEMSQAMTQAFHPLEYRHGPISLIDGHSVVVVLHSADGLAAEQKVAAEVRAKGAVVISLGGPGEPGFAADAPVALRPLVYLPALQVLGERVAQMKGLDTAAPRHLTKVVVLA